MESLYSNPFVVRVVVPSIVVPINDFEKRLLDRIGVGLSEIKADLRRPFVKVMFDATVTPEQLGDFSPFFEAGGVYREEIVQKALEVYTAESGTRPPAQPAEAATYDWKWYTSVYALVVLIVFVTYLTFA